MLCQASSRAVFLESAVLLEGQTVLKEVTVKLEGEGCSIQIKELHQWKPGSDRVPGQCGLSVRPGVRNLRS